MFYIYILQNPDKRFYIGQTNDIDRRLYRHNGDMVKSTKNRGPWTLVYQESYQTRSQAMIREKQLKKWNRTLLTNLMADN